MEGKVSSRLQPDQNSEEKKQGRSPGEECCRWPDAPFAIVTPARAGAQKTRGTHCGGSGLRRNDEDGEAIEAQNKTPRKRSVYGPDGRSSRAPDRTVSTPGFCGQASRRATSALHIYLTCLLQGISGRKTCLLTAGVLSHLRRPDRSARGPAMKPPVEMIAWITSSRRCTLYQTYGNAVHMVPSFQVTVPEQYNPTRNKCQGLIEFFRQLIFKR